MLCSTAMSATLGPHEVLEQTAKKLNLVIAEGQSYYKEDPERLYAKVNDLLETLFDFDAFARGVMGAHFSVSSEVQRANFATSLKRNLVHIFTDGLISMSAYSFKVLPAKPPKPQSKRAKVTMQVTMSDNVRHALDYSFALGGEGLWRVRNVVFDGVNFALSFRTQFADQVTKSAGSIEAALENWEITVEQ